MSGPARKVEHSALTGGEGAPLFDADLSDQSKLAVVLQAAGLLSLLDAAEWHLATGFDHALVDNEGRLLGLEASMGASTRSVSERLRELLLRLFHTQESVAGRGQGRKAARALLERWSGGAEKIAADRTVTDLLEVAPFLTTPAFLSARAALVGRLERDGRTIDWRAGRGRSRRRPATGGDLEQLVEAANWREAVRVGRAHPDRAARSPLLWARALAEVGRLEQALFVVEGDQGAVAETLRAECRAALGELGAARESIRRLEAMDLDSEQLLSAGDIALRVLANRAESEAAREWAVAALSGARGARKTGAQLLIALAAVDRGDLDAAGRLLAETVAAPSDERASALRLEVELQIALARHDGQAAERLAIEKLARGRRRMGRVAAGRAWSNLGYARSLRRDFSHAERAYAHARRLLHAVDGPLATTLAGANLADVRLRLGKLRGVEEILESSSVWNRRSGNLRGGLEDELLWARLEVVRGELPRAVDRCRRARARCDSGGLEWIGQRLAVLEARALGWLQRPAEALQALEGVPQEAFGELEPEEIPFLLALAGDTDRALERVDTCGFAALVRPLVRGEEPPARWSGLDRLESYRRARFVLDAELSMPGAVPRGLRSEAASRFRQLGAASVASVCERGEAVAWRALGRFFARPAGDRMAIEELFAAIGHSEAELVVAGADGELRIAGGGGRWLAAERTAPLGADHLVLRAAEIDEPLRALFALFLRDLPAPESHGERGGSPLAGESPLLRAALERLERFAATDLPVLILGANGTGKELAAAEVHRASARASGAWVPVNCAGLSETLLLSELFGHVRGAFSGADRPRAGVFEAARGGTVFLDEVGDLPLPAQGSLLRVLQEKEIRRLGESLPRKVDVRVVAATNRELEAMVEEGTFRQDLYFRLKVATVELPPLRERGGDVLLLAERFLEAMRARLPNLRLTPEARRALTAHSWPGNVRELKNSLEAAAALADDGRIGPEHLDLGTALGGSIEGDYHQMIEAYRRRLIEAALDSSEGSLAGAARQLGVTRQFLSQFVRKYGLEVRR